ncbi:YadA C-terminal domain-containing protein, partial [Salmonella enterica]|nr:YadA C-terminal domain-containing protein [Salmonella enterica]
NTYKKSTEYTDNRIQETGTYFTEQSTNYTDSRFADAVNYTDRQIDSVNKRISNLDSKINKNRKQASAGIAGAMAMSTIPQHLSYEFTFGMGMANFDNEQAISAGGYYNLNNRTTVSLKTSLDTQNNLGIAAGLSYGW